MYKSLFQSCGKNQNLQWETKETLVLQKDKQFSCSSVVAGALLWAWNHNFHLSKVPIVWFPVTARYVVGQYQIGIHKLASSIDDPVQKIFENSRFPDVLRDGGIACNFGITTALSSKSRTPVTTLLHTGLSRAQFDKSSLKNLKSFFVKIAEL